MSTDLTFITNEEDKTLKSRFEELIKDTRFFDVLVGYFYTSGFYALYKSLENTEKIRILIGISTNKQTADLINQPQQQFQFSHSETKSHFSDLISEEMSKTNDNRLVEEGVVKFLEWIRNGKLEIKAYPTENIHAKLYIMTFLEGDRDKGRVITGSSNFTQSGLVDNLEFNVELKTRADYDFAKDQFGGLWKDAVDVKDKYVETIQQRTWLNNTITPYQLYLKFLYEYFKDELRQTDEVLFKYVPTEFKRLEYQEQAVLNAKKILYEYGGVFLADVVGLGKTYMSTMLAGQIDGRTLVIAPPVLLEESNPGSWPSVFSDFRVAADFESIGKLDHILRRGTDKYKNIIIDEAHRFRTESNITYEKLARITRGKRVVLVSATPYNNTPKDILSQIKLFQKAKKSTIPNVPNLEAFFSQMEKRLKKLDRRRDHDEYIATTRQIAREIREKVLKYIMVRRTRSEIENFFKEDLEKQELRFPEVADPEAVFYQLNEEESDIFNRTVELIAKKFRYARYMPLLYYEGKITQPEKQGQMNMGKFMKILLVKRLESSFYAFNNSISRFISSYTHFLEEYKKGNVYVSKKYITKVFELLENDDDVAIQELIEEDKVQKYDAKDFKKSFKEDLEHDLEILIEIQRIWRNVRRDPKILSFTKLLSSENILKKNKVIIFTESKETAQYLARELETIYQDEVLSFYGGSSAISKEKVVENFDANARFRKNDYKFLISTEVLSEGVNLHASNVVINYDIPWNPTRMMQRVGRINRVDTDFDKIYTYNFFPTEQSNDEIKLKEAAEGKIQAFITLLGADARLLTEGEVIESHELFNRLVSKKTITEEDDYEESELKYLQVIRDIREDDPDLFEKVKRLPKKARTARRRKITDHQLLTYFRKGKIQKFFVAGNEEPKEFDFISAAKLLEAQEKTARAKLREDFYDKLDKNKKSFEFITAEGETSEVRMAGGRDSSTKVWKILKAIKDHRQFTEEQEMYLKQIIKQLEDGAIPKQTTKKTLQELQKELKRELSPLRVLALLQKSIPFEFLEGHIAESSAQTFGHREVILSEYMIGENG